MSLNSKIIDFVKSFTRRRTVSLSDSLFGTLGLDGQDAASFLSQYAEQFEVDLSSFVFEEYFGEDGIGPLDIPSFLWRSFRSMIGHDPHKIANVRTITLNDLVEAARVGRWMSEKDLAGKKIQGASLPKQQSPLPSDPPTT